MEHVVSLPSQISINSIDDALEAIKKYPEADINISATLSFKSILSAASYIQFFLSWANAKKHRKLTITVKNQSELDFLGRAAETFIPLALATEVYISSLETGQTERLDHNTSVREGLDLFSQLGGGLPMQQTLFGESEFNHESLPRKGTRIHLLAADFAGVHATPNWFYKGSRDARKLRSSNDFSALVRSVLTLIRGHLGKKFGLKNDKLSDDLGTILFELIDNTHRWGRHGLSNEPANSFRGVLFDVRFDHPGSQVKLADIASEIPLIGEYIRYHQSMKETSNLGLLEMTVFDGGIGLPTRELAKRNVPIPKDAPLADQYSATIACLRKWGTTSSDGNRGLGLDKVLELAALHRGLVYLRTGSLALFRDFANKPNIEQAESGKNILEKYKLEDAINLNLDPTYRDHVEGTLFSIVLPFSTSEGIP